MSNRSVLAAMLTAACLGATFLAGSASSAQSRNGDPGPAIAVPFAPGEKAEYQVKLGPVSVGSGTMEVLGIEDVEGFPTFHTRLHVKGGLPLARVDTRMDSWIDTAGLFSRRFEQDQHELRFERHRIFDFYPASRSYRLRGSGEIGRLPTNRPLDDLAFLYYARTLPLNVGDSYTIERYFKEDGNPVVLNVLRRETIQVPAGTFETIVVQPIIQTDGLFSEGGEAEVYFTDDDRRLLVYLRSKVPIVGALHLSLRSYEPGTPVPARR
ncbi:MAG: DUF3108 domain-containing protein [Gemmatimonadota bacterium]